VVAATAARAYVRGHELLYGGSCDWPWHRGGMDYMVTGCADFPETNEFASGGAPIDPSGHNRAIANADSLAPVRSLFRLCEYHFAGRDEDISADLDPDFRGRYGRVDPAIPGHQKNGGADACIASSISDESSPPPPKMI
jgi:hypothetical protein